MQSSLVFAQTGGIVADGSVGTAGNFGVSQTLATGSEMIAPDVVIGEALGTLSGSNLLHSFSEFNIQTDGSVTFTADTTPHANIQNVISRVTGNNVSNNDGMLRSSINDASSDFGVSGNVDVQAPNVDLVGSLITLPESLLDANSQLPERCATKLNGNYSSLIVVGRGGVPLTPGGYIPAYQVSGGD